MKRILILVAAIIVLVGCSKNNTNEVNIRLFNASSFDFKNITVSNTTYADLEAGEKSDYQLFEQAYRYAFVELEIEGATYTIQPIDFVGETPLENGDYTYRLDANDSQEQYGKLSINLIED